jgi:hypothetical protein
MKDRGQKITAGYNEFRFEFDLYDGSDPGKLSFDDTNVVEYEFINQGNTVCIINGGLRLYPGFTMIAPDRWKGTINDKENDTTIYRYKFEPLDFSMVYATYVPPGLPPPITELAVPGFAPYKDFLFPESPVFDRLLVITKIKAKL